MDLCVDFFIFIYDFHYCPAAKATALSLRAKIDSQISPTQLFWYPPQIRVALFMANCSGPEGAKQPQTITLAPPCLTVGSSFQMFFVFLNKHQM